jgi:hypothetical protein
MHNVRKLLGSRNLIGQTRNLALAGRKPVDGRADDWSIFPYEREGMEMNLNWALNRVKVIPRADAYHNPRQQLLADRLRQNAENMEIKLHGMSKSSNNPVLEAGTEQLTFDGYDAMEEEVKNLFSQVGCDLFVATGSIGSFRGASVSVRVISDHPGVCLLAQNLLIPAPYIKYENFESPLPSIVLYVTGRLSNFSGVQYQEGEGGGLIGAAGVLSGAAGLNQESLIEAIRITSSALLLEKENVIPLPASVLRKGDKTALLFNASDAEISDAYNQGFIYCSNGSILCPSKGISAMFGSLTVPHSTVTFSKKQERWATTVDNFSTFSVPQDNLAYFPKSVLIMNKTATGELSSDQVQKVLVDSNMEEDSITRFMESLQSSNITVQGVSSIKEAIEKVV